MPRPGTPTPFLFLFYADDGTLAGTDSTHVQSNFDVITAGFASLGLKMNAKKTEFMSTRGKYRAYHLTKTAHQFKYGGGEGMSQTELNREKVTCGRCGASIQRRRLAAHQQTKRCKANATATTLPPEEVMTCLPVSNHFVIDMPRGGDGVKCPVG